MTIRLRVLALHARGLPAKAIAQDVGRSIGRVYGIVHASGRSRHTVRYQRVLDRLRQAEGIITATVICRDLGIARHDVVHAVDNLRSQGHHIQSFVGGRGGYRLLEEVKS